MGWIGQASGNAAGPAGGDLIGTYPNPLLGRGIVTGDILVFIAGTGWVNVGVGADGLALVADHTQASGVNWLAVSPGGAAGGDLAGTYPNPTVAKLNGVAAASYALLASPALTGTPTVPTAALGVATTQAASTAFLNNAVFGCVCIGPGAYALPGYPGTVINSTGSTAASDYKWVRLVIPKTGTLHDVSVLIQTSSGNGGCLVLDDGQAAAGTTRTVIATTALAACPAAGSWMTVDPNLAVVQGQTICFAVQFDNTTAKVAASNGNTGSGNLPTSNFFPGSGASTNNQKLNGSILAANLTNSLNSTVTNANFTVGATPPLFVFRIT